MGVVTVNIAGYRQLSPAEQDSINAIKSQANETAELVAGCESDVTCDQRWVAIAKTHLQQGYMALVRAIAQPRSF